MSQRLSVAELEQLYSDVVLQQQFYGDSYGSDWSLEPYDAMAQLLREILAPTKHLDVGCGKGFLVLAMRRLGISSFGLDFSEALIRQVPAEVKPYVDIAKAEDWITSPLFQDADLITYMEVFEHLPVSICARILQTLRDNFTGRLFVTIPSFGVDERFGLGIRTNAGTAAWQEDMARNTPFHNIVLKESLPHHGHITLCSYRWWSEFFLYHGWVRSRDLEAKAASQFQPTLMKYNWNPYILERISLDCLSINIDSSNQIGSGWHDAESGAVPGRWTNGRGELLFQCESSKLKDLSVALTAPTINFPGDYSLIVVVEEQVITESYELSWRCLFTSSVFPIQKREQLVDIKVPLSIETSRNPGHGPKRNTLRVTLLSPSFRPKDLGFSDDDRTLGVFVKSVRLSATL